jgi:glycosyltransferase involved in cell wall biosynthesis
MSDSTAWDERRAPWKEWVKSHIVKMCAAGLVAGTPHKDYLVQLGMPAERIFLGYDAVDNRYFGEKAEEVRKQTGEVFEDFTGQGRLHGPRKSEVRRKYGLPEKYFLASARFVEKKNLPRLLQAFARYRALTGKSEIGDRRSETANQKGAGEMASPISQADFPISAFKNDLRTPNPELWHLVLLGGGPLKSDLSHLISDLRLDACVHLPGFKQYDELPAYYGLAGAFIHASTTEQWGLVVNEAMASGLPVLVSNRCGCAQDLVKEGVNGFTFDPCNVEQLAQLMLKLSTLDPEKGRGPHGALRPQLSAFGSESQRIISHWGPERFASGLKSAAEKAMEVGPKRAGIVDRLLLRVLLAR